MEETRLVLRLPSQLRTAKCHTSRAACLLQQNPPRRIYRRIKRDNGPSKSKSNSTSAPAAAPASTTGRGAVAPQPPHQGPPSSLPVLDFDVTEARKAVARWGPMGAPPTSAPLMIWPLHSGNPNLQSQIIRVEKEHVFPEDRGECDGGEDPPLLAEESSSGSRVNSKKRSAPTTLVNTPHMLQQLAKEGSSRDSTCSSNSDETGSQGSDESDDSEPDVVSRQQHPFGMQNGLKGTGVSPSQPRASTASTGQGPSAGCPAPFPAGQGTSSSNPAPGGRVRSISPVPVGVMAASQPMSASQLRQRRQQEDAMPSTGYHVPGKIGPPVMLVINHAGSEVAVK